MKSRHAGLFLFTHNRFLKIFWFRGVEFILRSFLYNSSIKILFSSTLKQSELEIDAILNENKIRPPSLFEGYRKRDVVFTKYFSQPTFTIDLRPFVIQTDLPFVYEALHAGKNADINSVYSIVAASYLYTGASDFARSFSCLLNNRLMLGSIDIVDALKDELCDCTFFRQGDYIIRLLVSRKKKTISPLLVKMLTTCMEYFFLFPEVKQLFIELSTADKDMIDLVQECGFNFYTLSDSQYCSVIIFQSTRQSLIV